MSDKAEDSPPLPDETFSPAEIELTAIAIEARQTDLGDCPKGDCVNALNAAVAFLRICGSLLTDGSPRTAFDVLNQAKAACERAGLMLETYGGPEAEDLRERLTGIEQQLRHTWASIEKALE